MERRMTKEEALNKIGELVVYARTQGWDEEFTEAFETLSAEPCEDAISRQEVFEKAVYTETEEGWCGYTVDVGYIKSLLSVTPKQKMGNWIPISERLPEKNMACFVAVGKFNLTQMAMYSDLMGTIDHRIFYQGDCGHENFSDITEYVNAWMPLPERYKGERDE